VLLDQRLLEVVAPGAGGGHEQRLGLGLVELGHRARFQVGEVVQPHEHRLGHARRVVDVARSGRPPQDPLDATPVVGVEAVARHEHEAGDEALERVVADEQAQALAGAEVKDAHRDPEQVVLGDLEQLVTRIALEDLEQRLFVVALGREGGAPQHGLHLAPQDRYVPRAGLVGGMRVETQEAAFADHPAVAVEALDADVVEVRGPVHGRARVRFGEVEQVRLQHARAHRRRQLVEAARALLGMAQDAEPRSRDRHEAQLGGRAGQLVVAEAEEGEVVVLKPGEEGARLGDVGGVERRRLGAQLGHQVEGPRTHLGPVGHRRADLVDHSHQVRLQLVQLRGLGVARDLGVHDRLGHGPLRGGAVGQHLEQAAVGVPARLDDRVDDQVDAEAASVQLHPDRIDQERHVVGHDLHGGMPRLPPVDLVLGVVDADLGGARRPLPG
jgi:hypothetical protein